MVKAKFSYVSQNLKLLKQTERGFKKEFNVWNPLKVVFSGIPHKGGI